MLLSKIRYYFYKYNAKNRLNPNAAAQTVGFPYSSCFPQVLLLIPSVT